MDHPLKIKTAPGCSTSRGRSSQSMLWLLQNQIGQIERRLFRVLLFWIVQIERTPKCQMKIYDLLPCICSDSDIPDSFPVAADASVRRLRIGEWAQFSANITIRSSDFSVQYTWQRNGVAVSSNRTVATGPITIVVWYSRRVTTQSDAGIYSIVVDTNTTVIVGAIDVISESGMCIRVP